jgi:ABC-2 type transport system permease protein
VISKTAPGLGTTATATYGMAAHATPGFGATLRAEWTKLRSVRSTWIIASLAIGLSIGFSALVALVTGLTYDGWSASAQTQFDPVLTPMSGLLFSCILVAVLGVTTVTSEYSSRMIRTTLIGNPRRLRVLAAKGAVVAMLGLAINIIVVPSLFLISQPIYGHYGLATASIGDSAAIRLLLVTVLGQGFIYTLLPFAFAWMLRGTASAITVSIGFLFMPWTVGAVVPPWVRHNILRYLPDAAENSLSGLTKSDATGYLTQTPAIAVVVIWLVGVLAVAAVVLNRRDV